MQRRNVLQLTGATLATGVGVGWLATGEEVVQDDPIEFDDPEELLLDVDALPGDGWEEGDPEEGDILDVRVTFTRIFDEGEEGNGGEGDSDEDDDGQGSFSLVVSAVGGREDADAAADLYEELETDFVEQVGEARVMDLDLASEAVIAGYDGFASALFRDVNCVAAVSFTDCAPLGICFSDVGQVEELARIQRESWRTQEDEGGEDDEGSGDGEGGRDGEGGDGGEGQLEVVEINEDAPGNDHDNPNGEYVVFQNAGDASLDLTGWRVEDEAEHAYNFPGGFSLDSGQEVTLYSGTGEDTDTELYWGSEQAIWNNGGDTVFVYDDSGEVVVEREYG